MEDRCRHLAEEKAAWTAGWESVRYGGSGKPGEGLRLYSKGNSGSQKHFKQMSATRSILEKFLQ
jgi:hypothetical protein